MNIGPARTASALLLLSAGGLLFEIALTRVLSVLYFSSFSYLVLSLAVLGLAVGAALAALLPSARLPSRWSQWCALFGLGALLVTLLVPMAASLGLRYLLIPLTCLPYTFLGMALAGIFAERWSASSRLYLADLAGAGLGALLAVPLLDLGGGIFGMFAAAVAPTLAALLLAPRAALALAATVSTALALTLQLAGIGIELDLARLATPKPIRQALRSGGQIVDSRWDAFARSDLVRMPGERYLIYLDGGAGSLVPDASAPQTWLSDVGALAFAISDPQAVFLIGPGGGLDIALAREFGAQRIVAAEVNRGAVELTRGLATHAGKLYGARTRLTIDDGRSALRRVEGEFDLILLSHVVTQAAEARGMALAENGLYTVEAFGEYLDRLTEGGLVALKLYDELTLTRAMVTALASLDERGTSTAVAARHLFAALDTRASPPVPLLLVSAEPLSVERAVSWARSAEEHGLNLLYVPELLAPPLLDEVLAGSAGWERIVEATQDVNLSPSRDAQPFFYQFELGLPRTLWPLVLSVGILLALALLLGAWRTRQAPAVMRASPWIFGALGAGFMLIEISVLQRVQLLIGHPTLTLATVLAALLLGAATGSGLSQRVQWGREFHWVAFCCLAAAGLTLAWLALWPGLEDGMRALPPALAALGTAVLLLPWALPLGAPFPLALRAVGRHGSLEVAIAWSLNGLASVAGAVAATALAIVYGFEVSAGAAVAVYGAVALLALLLVTRQE